ncbi:hypothetical protein ACP70R_015367 [Stipagrostis hirtigluma subsp. patula]
MSPAFVPFFSFNSNLSPIRSKQEPIGRAASMEGAAQTLVTSAAQLLSGEYQLLRGVGGEVAELRDDMATMNALLHMQSEADEGAVDHFSREWMNQLRELAYDSEDCVDLYRLRIKSRPNDGLRAWLRRLLETLMPRRRLAGEISELRARAAAISERHARYGVNRDALRRSPSLSAPPVLADALRRPADGPGRHQVVGMEEQVESLVNKLLKPPLDGERHLKVFSIVGFGGLGKTTLAMEVCRRLEAEFPYQAMVSVSQAFEPSRDLRTLLKDVLQQIVMRKTKKEGIMEEEAVRSNDEETTIKEYLKDKRFLIVIDDVWTIRAWERIIQALLPAENVHDSRIIVTTRIAAVAKACSTASVRGDYIHDMKPLEDKDSKKLFLSRVFGSMDDSSCPKELQVPMNDILKKCGGLPLAIVSIASVLAGYTSPGSHDKWETIYKSIGYQMKNNPSLEGMRQIIILSYNHLPHELKACVMYLSIFPEDYEINKDRLVCRWIAEGLVLEKRGLTLVDVAESYLDELVSRNMVIPRSGFDGKVESCRVHDMLLEVMVSTSLECNFVSLLGGQYAGMSYNRIRRLSIQGGDDRRDQDAERSKKKKKDGGSIEGIDVEHVRSLSMFKLQKHELLSQLGKFTLLRVLDLEDCEEGVTDKHMVYICRLYLLRFLNLSGTNVSNVPPEIGNLEHLQTFDVNRTFLQRLPETVTKLEKLERQGFSNRGDWEAMWTLPRGLSKMKALREVGLALLGNNVEVAEEVGKLEHLETLTIYINSGEIPHTGPEAQVLKTFAGSLSNACSLRHLNIGDLGYTQILKFLHHLKPLLLLRYLRIAGEVGESLPTWIGSLTHLVEFTMSWAKFHGDQPFDILCKAPNLKSITMEPYCYIGDKLVARKRHNFPSLISLHLNSLDNTTNVYEFEEGSMPKLEAFKFGFSDREKRIVGIDNLTSLKEVHVRGKSNDVLLSALDQLKGENRRRLKSNQPQLQIVVKYE